MHEITKLEFIETFKNNFYNFYSIPKERLIHLIDSEMIFDQILLLEDEIISCGDFSKIDLDKIENKYFQFFKAYAIRLEGEMFTYDEEIVPISIWTNYDKEYKLFTFRFHSYTIDDASMDLLCSVDNLDKIFKLYKSAAIFLNKYTKMPNNKDFEDFWLKETKENKCYKETINYKNETFNNLNFDYN